MTTIGKPGSRPSLTVKPEPKPEPVKQTAQAQRANAVKTAVAQRMKDGFDAAPRTGSASRPVLSEIRGEGAPVGPGTVAGKPKPPVAATGPQVSTNANGQTVVDLGAGNNDAKVTMNRSGGLVITSGSETVTLSPEQSKNAIIQGGAGNDTITVDPNVTVDVTIDGGIGNDKLTGGAGNDTITGGAGNDTIIGGAGNDSVSGDDGDDYVEGGAGDDLVNGGAGRDVMYGLDGDDLLNGGEGRDYIDAGAGNDTATGGAGDDQVIGGRGDDSLSGGEGNDAVAGGEGKDTVSGNGGDDKLYVEEGEKTDDVAGDTRTIVDMTDADKRGSSVSVKGSAEFQARVQSDLDAMRSLPSGQDLLRSLDASGKTTTIQETTGGNTATGTNFNDGFFNKDGTAGKGTDATVNYNTSRISLGADEWMNRPPIVGLFHELVHASDLNNGTLANGSKDGVRNLETSAVGLPVDLDQNPATPDVVQGGRPGENVLRDDLNLPTRPHY